jgi:hypothetical protein
VLAAVSTIMAWHADADAVPRVRSAVRHELRNYYISDEIIIMKRVHGLSALHFHQMLRS